MVSDVVVEALFILGKNMPALANNINKDCKSVCKFTNVYHLISSCRYNFKLSNHICVQERGGGIGL